MAPPSEFLNISITFLLFAILLIVIACQIAYNVYFHPLSHIPGPLLAKLTNLHYVCRFLTGYEPDYDSALFQRYGPLVRTAPNVLIFNNPRWLPLIYHRSADKGPSYTLMKKFGLMGVLSHKEHTSRRKKLAPPFSVSNIKKMTPIISRNVEQWIAGLADTSITDGVVDFGAWTTYLTYDVLSDLCFGKSLGFCKAKCDVGGLVANFDRSVIFLGLLIRWPRLLHLAEKVGLGWILEVSEETKGVGDVLKFRNGLIKERLDNPSDRPDVLGHLLNAMSSKDLGLDMQGLKDEVLLLMTAGTDTTSGHLRDLFRNILTTPGVYSNLIASDFSSRIAATESPYLDACIKETLRIQSPATTPFPRLVSEPGVHLGPYFVPANVEVYAPIHSIHLDSEIFGEDPKKWKPERWLDIDPETAQRRARYLHTWGSGSRVCLGRPVAETEIRMAARRFFECFDVEFVKEGGCPEPKMYGFRNHKGLMMRLKAKEGARIMEPNF